MVTRATRFAAACAAASAFAPLLAQPGRRGFKIGACDWSLRRMNVDAFDLAKQIGLDGVQVSLGTAANRMHLRQAAVQQAYLEASRRTGVAIASLAIGEMNNIPLKSDPRAALWLVDSIPVMRALGVNVVLIAQFYKGDLKDDKEGIDRTVGALQEIAPRAEKAGVILGLENYLSAEENLGILDRVKSPAVQVYYDVGNSTDKGYDIYREIRLLKGRVCEFHAKDAGHMLGRGRVDFHKVREAIDDIGYRGWIQIEAAAPKDLVTDYQAHLKFLKSVFPPA
ncbi:MAG: sugar phosphate isomerase/epimerase [Verrucomicrobia bacterium]|nr:sugar phosphate isomerase/epimerase [Verrucomicrobiota bacterium]